jgi:hypothetical protein
MAARADDEDPQDDLYLSPAGIMLSEKDLTCLT